MNKPINEMTLDEFALLPQEMKDTNEVKRAKQRLYNRTYLDKKLEFICVTCGNKKYRIASKGNHLKTARHQRLSKKIGDEKKGLI